MKRFLTLALPLFLTAFLTVLASRIAIFFIPEIAGLFGIRKTLFDSWRSAAVTLSLAVPVLSGVIVTMLSCGLKGNTGSRRALRAVLITLVAVVFTVLTVISAKVDGNALIPLLRTVM